MPTYIVTVTAADAVGIVNSVTGTIFRQGGNVIELSQTVLRDFFTIILAVEFPEAKNTRTLAAAVIAEGSRFDLTVAVIEVPVEAVPPPVADGERFILTVLGNDHPGNIHRIAGRLSQRGVNIVDLHARADGPRFSLVTEVFLPHDLSPRELRADLEEFGRELGLECFVQHENIFLATTEPSPVRVGASSSREGAAVVPH
ncbi:MAG: ACT domain-containing protein [Isosphaeraceae bacterium]|nr:ACT domain-containing protein [Isosphaeraceae bacterium]